MSTKCTIACAEEPTDFHLYYDYADEKIHLDMPNVSFVIPRDVIKEIIREVKEPNFMLPGELDEKEL